MISSAQNTAYEGFSAFLERNMNTDLLRFTTAGSVDDGKSTLIGRLLHDSKAVYEDQLASVKKSRINRTTGAVDAALLHGGQPIFIDGLGIVQETPDQGGLAVVDASGCSEAEKIGVQVLLKKG